MQHPREEHRTGLAYLEAVTALLQRVRATHPTAGSFEAAEFQWWWSRTRTTDEQPQLFWFDDDDRPAAAVIMTSWADAIGLDPLVLPDSDPAWLTAVMDRGLAHAAAHDHHAIDLEVGESDAILRAHLESRGFAVSEDGLIENWLDVADRPPISPLHDGYALSTRQQSPDTVYHYDKRSGAAAEARLQQTSLYRSDLDLFIRHDDGRHAAHGIAWYDPVTATGVVEPMRTEDEHQRKGLARHLLTTAVDRLAAAGATRVKICVEVANEPARALYHSVGFEPVAQTVIYSRRSEDAAD